MTTQLGPIYLGTVLLEANRWTPGKTPTFRVSEMADAIAAAGFAGLELWENHAALAEESELAALGRLPIPIAIFNGYCPFDDAGAAARGRTAMLARRLRAGGVKLNFGNAPALAASYVANLRAWAHELPMGCRLLCECHGGTVLESPDNAARILAPLEGRVEIIVHAFAGERQTLQRWLDRFGRSVTHVHVASRAGNGPMRRLSDAPDESRDRIAMLRAAGFAGTWTIEFTAGVAQPPEDRKALLANAASDLAFLKANFTGAGA